jgi:hypothetical protein
VTDISGREKGTIFRLSDQTDWIATHSDLTTATEPLKVGAEVFLSSTAFKTVDEEFWIEYESAGFSKCFLTRHSLRHLPTVKEVHRICTMEPGWFTPGEYIYVIELSDGSKWKKITDEAKTEFLRNWKCGDRIILAPTEKNNFNTWNIYNIDRMVSFDSDMPDLKTGIVHKYRLHFYEDETFEPYSN